MTKHTYPPFTIPGAYADVKHICKVHYPKAFYTISLAIMGAGDLALYSNEAL